jgi:murein DD-endopeptidase MepM/ murein hydrolase activator NlpD
MRSLVPVLLPAAATALAVTTVSTVALPSDLSEAPPPRAPVALSPPPDRGAAPISPARPTPGARSPRAASALTAPRGRWAWPLEPRPPVARQFVRPSSAWGAGHRGVDLTTSSGRDVLTVDDGLVAHVGVVAGRGTVTVLHRSGLRSTYEPLDALVEVGDVVTRGQRLGTLAAGGHCAPKACMHLGALRGETYLDPLTLLGPTRVRLLPLR